VFDRYNRNINYLRISVTDRCNLRCTYCMPEEGIRLLDHKEILTFDEIYEFTRTAVAGGVTKVRITGGEPLVRRGIITLVGMISQIAEIRDLSMTTNGVLLKQFAGELKSAGLKRINISLDTVDSERFAAVTRGGSIIDVFDGINAAREAGLFPIKINCVIQNSEEEAEARAVAKFCRDNNLEIRYITQMDLVKGHFSTVVGGTGGNCELCNRLRLTSNGKLKPCLFSNLEYDIRELGFEKALKLAIQSKPECGSTNETGAFYNIGG
jgi:GTP 3',8-cyclase